LDEEGDRQRHRGEAPVNDSKEKGGEPPVSLCALFAIDRLESENSLTQSKDGECADDCAAMMRV